MPGANGEVPASVAKTLAPATEFEEGPKYNWSFQAAVAATVPILVTANWTVKACPNCALAGALSGPSTKSGALITIAFVANKVLLLLSNSGTAFPLSTKIPKYCVPVMLDGKITVWVRVIELPATIVLLTVKAPSDCAPVPFVLLARRT